MVFRHRQLGLAGDRGAVIGNDDEQRIVEPGMTPRLLDELADGEIRVLDRAFTPAGRGNVDAPVRVGIGALLNRTSSATPQTFSKITDSFGKSVRSWVT
jgi:hypothetical protein